MHDTFAQLLTYAHSTWRFRWYAQMVAWPLCLAGWVVVYMLPNQYEATARIFVDTQSMLRPLLQGLTVQTNAGEQVQVMTRTLLSRPNLEKVARATDMDLRAQNPEEMEGLLNGLAKKIVMTNARRENIFSIGYTDSQPQMAQAVVQSLVALFVESSLGSTRTDTSAAQRFIDEQIKEYEAKLFLAEDRLKEFKRQNVNVMPSEGRGYYDRLQSESAVLERTKLELLEAENRREELRRQLTGEEPTFGMVSQVSQTATSPNETRIQVLEGKLDELLLRYTDEHPDVVEMRRQITELRERDRKSQVAKQPNLASQSAPLETNPVYQRVKIALSEAETSVVALRVRLNEFQNRVSQLSKLVNTVPQVEAELARLNRDYAINTQNYETLIARRESAKISEEAEQSSDNYKFKIIDPPRVSINPVAPNRPLFATIVLLLGVVSGLLFSFFLAQIKPTFDNQRSVMLVTNLPVLGYVSAVVTDSTRIRGQLEVVSYICASIGLFLVYGFFLYMQMLQRVAAQ